MVGIGRLFVDLGGSAKQALGRLEIPPLQSNHAQAIECLEVALVRPENQLVKLFCFSQPTLRMKGGPVFEGMRRVGDSGLEEGRYSWGHDYILRGALCTFVRLIALVKCTRSVPPLP